MKYLDSSKAFAVLVGIFALSVASCADTDTETQSEGRVTGNDISMDPSDPNYIGNFLPELEQTVARFPQIDPETGVHVSEIKPGLFYVTEGVYQSAFLSTDEGSSANPFIGKDLNKLHAVILVDPVAAMLLKADIRMI